MPGIKYIATTDSDCKAYSFEIKQNNAIRRRYDGNKIPTQIGGKPVLFIFPGNNTHHTENTGPYTLKGGDGLAQVAAAYGEEQEGATASLPTTNYDSGVPLKPDDPIVKNAILDLFRSAAAGFQLLCPVKKFTAEADTTETRFFEKALQYKHLSQEVVPSFYGENEKTANPALSTFYIDCLDKLDAFMNAPNKTEQHKNATGFEKECYKVYLDITKDNKAKSAWETKGKFISPKLFGLMERGSFASMSALPLTAEQQKKLRHGESIECYAPNASPYSFSIKPNGSPKAELTHDDSRKTENETEIQYQTRLARTVIGMINDVIANGKVIKVDTEEPFVSAIAALYLNTLQAEGMRLDVTITLQTGKKDKAQQAKAEELWATVIALECGPARNKPWYTDAKKHQGKERSPSERLDIIIQGLVNHSNPRGAFHAIDLETLAEVTGFDYTREKDHFHNVLVTKIKALPAEHKPEEKEKIIDAKINPPPAPRTGPSL